MSKKLRFCAKLPTNRAFGPVRRARRGAILNEKGVHHPFFKLFPRTFLLLLCFFRQSGALRAIGRAGRFFYYTVIRRGRTNIRYYVQDYEDALFELE